MNRTLIRKEIEKLGLRRVWLAAKIGVHPTTLNRFLNGKTVLGSEALMELLTILKLKPEALLKKAS